MNSQQQHPPQSNMSIMGTQMDDTQQQQQQFDNNIQMAANQNPISSPSTIDMYQANPYSVHSSQPIGIAVNTNRVKSTPMPTPPPSLAKELDNCISKISIATHV